ncbi:hypothetical protein HY468_03015 [Candidatus Roizmanbacteria bacterium]|nr:hypothetical protein [Candidatus Roizmanbacteria bacterium]
MKKLMSIFVVIVLGFFTVTSVRAVTTTPTTDEVEPTSASKSAAPTSVRERSQTQEYKDALRKERDARREGLTTTGTQKKEAMQDAVEEKRALVQEKVQEGKEAIWRTHLTWMVRRFEVVIARLENIAARVSSRIDKIGEDHDITAAATQLTTAENSIAKAKETLVTLQGSIEGAVSADKKPEGFAEIKTLAQEIKTQLIAAHQAIRQAIVELKKIRITTVPTAGKEQKETTPSATQAKEE